MGTARRLQMTLDIYGKLLLTALELRRRPDVPAEVDDVWPDVDRLVVDADITQDWRSIICAAGVELSVAGPTDNA